MNPELEALLKAFESYMEARGEEAGRLHAIFQSRMDDVLERNPNLSGDALEKAIERRYKKIAWLKAKEYSTLPPKA